MSNRGGEVDYARDQTDVYGNNFQRAKKLAMARSGGKCQFCGLRKASDGHHWAWDNYPSDEEVQGHDITALCKTCHELATMLRDWVGRKHADLDQLEKEIADSNNFYEKREAFSYWLFPEEEEIAVPNFEMPRPHLKLGKPQALANVPVSSSAWTPDLLEIESTESSAVNFDAYTPVKTEKRGNLKDQIYGLRIEVDYLKDVRAAIKRQMGRLERGESLDSRAAVKDAKEIRLATRASPNSTWHELNDEYDFVGRQMRDLIREQEGLRKQQEEKSNGCGLFLAFCVIAAVLYVILSAYWT